MIYYLISKVHFDLSMLLLTIKFYNNVLDKIISLQVQCWPHTELQVSKELGCMTQFKLSFCVSCRWVAAEQTIISQVAMFHPTVITSGMQDIVGQA